jgi:hypothetical protein
MLRLTSLVLVVLAACADHPAAPPVSVRDAGNDAASIAPEDSQLIRPRVDLTAALDLRTILPLELVTPAAASNIGPGSAIVITIPDEGRFGCSANFIWRAGGRRFLGSAGHCFIPEALKATHGAGADYDASGVVVEVCIENCDGNFNINLLVGTWVRLGKVAYARQADAEGTGVGNDFGVAFIPREFQDLIRTALPVWGGPSGTHVLQLGDLGCHYGHGLLVGELMPTKARSGVGGDSDDAAWMGDFAAAFGDSGSGMVACEPDGLTLSGRGAVGVLTHIGVSVDPESGAHGVTFGTTMSRAVEMAREANLRLELVDG